LPRLTLLDPVVGPAERGVIDLDEIVLLRTTY
jgi:hypothetical protein